MADTTVSNCGTCGDFPEGGVNFGTKYMSDLMRTEAPWAKAILDADRLAVPGAQTLNPSNRNGNTYGALVLGFAVQPRGWEAADATVKEALNTWIKNLNLEFTAHKSYTPAQLVEFSDKLKESAACITRNSADLAGRGEISINDHAFWTGIANGLATLSANLGKLHDAVCAAPEIKEVFLDFPIQQH